jgi:predicted nucleic acid-binding Zn ribbon protein
MTHKKETLIPLKDIISGLLKDTELPFNPADARIWSVWEEAVGSGIASHARPSWIKNGCLRVNVSDSIWLQELEYFKETIIEKLNMKMGRTAVQRIDFRFGPL